jgi:hypothetical protein
MKALSPRPLLTLAATLGQVAQELSRLASIFLRDERGRRAVFGDNVTFQHDA